MQMSSPSTHCLKLKVCIVQLETAVLKSRTKRVLAEPVFVSGSFQLFYRLGCSQEDTIWT